MHWTITNQGRRSQKVYSDRGDSRLSSVGAVDICTAAGHRGYQPGTAHSGDGVVAGFISGPRLTGKILLRSIGHGGRELELLGSAATEQTEMIGRYRKVNHGGYSRD